MWDQFLPTDPALELPLYGGRIEAARWNPQHPPTFTHLHHWTGHLEMTDTPTLARTLGLRSLVLFGLAYLTPLIVLGIFGVVAEATGGASASAYLIALVAMIFTASSYGRMAAAYPVAGSAYTYVRRTVDSRIGFLVGWAVLLDYLFLPMVIWLIGAAYLNAQFPAVPNWLWIVGFIAITTVLNILGIKVADRANYVLMAFQVLVIALFVALSIGSVVSSERRGRALQRLAVRQPRCNLRGHLGRCGHRGILLPRLRRGHDLHRGDHQSAQDDAAGDPA